jgi:hypothetical protein
LPGCLSAIPSRISSVVQRCLHLGGLVGYSATSVSARVHPAAFKILPSGNCTSSLRRAPSQIVLSLPGIMHSQRLRSRAPWEFFIGFATKPNGWSLRHAFLRQNEPEVHSNDPCVCPYLSSCSLLMQRDMSAVVVGLRRCLLLSWWGVSVCVRDEGVRRQLLWRLMIVGQVMVQICMWSQRCSAVKRVFSVCFLRMRLKLTRMIQAADH